jgi:hypothetical protein
MSPLLLCAVARSRVGPRGQARARAGEAERAAWVDWATQAERVTRVSGPRRVSKPAQ